MIADLTLRWVVTILFALSFAECLYALAAGHRKWTHAVGHALHLVMAAAMIVMAWPIGMELPNRPPMAFFLLATLWFGGMAALGSPGPVERLGNEYHAVMMGAMAWMYAVMDGALLPGGTDGSPGGDVPSASMPGMPGMAMPSATTSGHPAEPQWITAVNWMVTVGFAIAAVWWLYRYVVQRRKDSTADCGLLAHAGTLCQSFMAAGMAIMFGVML
ncbi:DUF5134 domain-containing protein [Mycolicibacterium komossense]|uniref:DUF5134 domain-containing protein n=1 Tax=Mycolicibacterium komossense TaxID=1779 RepID=A0ABT3CG56_9MYCO|nr:DUF5134 domain-containing protein [Mycolicibacterium komossense]MCV7228459.1 DUF5134 domain-containing protein [Mycolicibacterium komossense]